MHRSAIKVNDIGHNFFSYLKGNLIKVTHVIPLEAVILLQKLLYLAKVASMQTIGVIYIIFNIM